MQVSKNKMSVLQLTILTTVNMMGSGIIMLPTKLAEVGTISILSWIVTAIGSMALAYAFKVWHVQPPQWRNGWLR